MTAEAQAQAIQELIDKIDMLLTHVSDMTIRMPLLEIRQGLVNLKGENAE